MFTVSVGSEWRINYVDFALFCSWCDRSGYGASNGSTEDVLNDDCNENSGCSGSSGKSDRSLFEVFTMSAVSTIKAECNGYTFEWGPNKYIVRINRAGHAVWKRWNDRGGWFRRVDRTACGESSFRAALDECVSLLHRAECDCSFGCDACSGDVSFGD